MTQTKANRTGNSDRRQREQENLRKMLRLADLAGCQFRPAGKSQLRGFCPFHLSTQPRNLRALRVNLDRGAFNCEFCGIEGTPALFAAHY